MKLQLAEEIGDFRRTPVEGIRKLPPQNAIPVDDVGLRNLNGPVEMLNLRAGIAHGYEVHVVLGDEAMVSAVVFISADGDHHHPLIFHELVHPDQRGRLCDAGWTPTRPEVQYYHLSLELAERHLALNVLHHEVRSRLADPGWLAAAVAARQEQETQDSNRERDSSHIDIIKDSTHGYASTSFGASGYVGDRPGP